EPTVPLGRMKMPGSNGNGGQTKGPPPADEPSKDEQPRTGYEIILADFRTRYDPTFRTGTSLYSNLLGREVKMGEACCAPPIELVDLLLHAKDAPRGKHGVERDAIPKFFWNWCKSAWRDLLDSLPVEDEGAEIAEGAAEDFRGKVAAAMLTHVT